MDFLYTYALTALKFAGVIVSGIAGVIATQPEKPARRILRLVVLLRLQNAARNTLNKNAAMRWVVVGLAIALLSQFVETIKTSKESKNSQEEYNAQMAVATNSMAKLEKQLTLSSAAIDELQSQSVQLHRQMTVVNHMAGEFDTLSIDATFELISTNPFALMLTKRVADLACPLNAIAVHHGKTITATFFDLSSLVGFDDGPEKPSREELAAKNGLYYSLGVAGYINWQANTTNIYEITNAPDTAIMAHLRGSLGKNAPYNEVFSSNWLSMASSNVNLMDLVYLIQKPRLGVRIYSPLTTGNAVSDADFVAPLSWQTSAPTIGYNSVTNGVVLKWTTEYPNSQWRQTVRMGSVHDLDSATLYFYLANVPNALTDSIKPVSLKLKFGKTNIKVREFEFGFYENVTTGFWPDETASSINRAAVYKAVLPPASYDSIEAEIKN